MNIFAVMDHGIPDEATILEMIARVRWWQGDNRFGEPWFEWRKRNGARGGRGGSQRELAIAVWRVFGAAWLTSVMLALVRRSARSSQASSRGRSQ